MGWWKGRERDGGVGGDGEEEIRGVNDKKKRNGVRERKQKWRRKVGWGVKSKTEE